VVESAGKGARMGKGVRTGEGTRTGEGARTGEGPGAGKGGAGMGWAREGADLREARIARMTAVVAAALRAKWLVRAT
jgi:hypothetical protein